MKKKIKYLLALLLLPAGAWSQAIDNNLSYRNIDNANYFRLNYENDFFTATDKYYTQGLYFEAVAPGLKYNPLVHLLIHPHADTIRYGLSLEHNAYTPTSIRHNEILYGDRPFCADLFLNSYLIATSAARKDRFSVSLSTGVIGPWAFGKEMQVGIHKALDNIAPLGWQNQIANDVVLNYQVDYEKSIVSYRNNFLISATGSARAGTLSDKAGAGFTLMAGSFNSPFQTGTAGKKLRFYVYNHAQVDVIGYDATMQGGLFSQGSDPYVIPAGDISRIVFTDRYGVCLTYKWLYLEYYQTYITEEYVRGLEHRTGGIQIGFQL